MPIAVAVRRSTTRKAFRNAANRRVSRRGCARCCNKICFGRPCLTVTFDPISLCHTMLLGFCQAAPDFPGGTFRLPLYFSASNSCIWLACFSGLGGDFTSELRDTVTGDCDPDTL